MPRLDETPFLYRFVGTETHYGPRDLRWIGRAYSNRPDCSASPAPDSGTPVEWLPIGQWMERLDSEPLSAKQARRLRSLKVSFDAQTTNVADAVALIEAAEAALPATAIMIKRLSEFGIDTTSITTRGQAKERLASVKLAARVHALRSSGCDVQEGVTIEALYALEAAYASFEMSLETARQYGLRLPRQKRLTTDRLQSLSNALDDFTRIAEDLPDLLREMQAEERIPRVPHRSAIKATLPFLFQMIQSGQWEQGGAARFAEQALGAGEPSA